MNFCKKLFKVYLNPSFWISNHPVDKKVDILINKVVDDDLVTSFDKYNAVCDSLKIEIWIRNYPYCFGQVSGIFPNHLEGMYGLPKRVTRLKLKEYLENKGCFRQTSSGIKEVDQILGIEVNK